MFQFKIDEHQNLIDFVDAAAESDGMREWLFRLEEVPEKIRTAHLQQLRNEMQGNGEPEGFVQIVELLDDDSVLIAMNRVIYDVLASGLKARSCLDGQADVLRKFKALVVLLKL